MAQQNELVVALKLVADQFKSGLASADSSLGQFAHAVTRMATDWKTASALIATSLTAITQAAGKHAEQLTHLSQETGDSTQKLQEMDVLLNRSGVSADAFARSMKTVAERLAEAKAGIGVGAQLFQAMGFTPEQIQQMQTANDALRALADRLTNYRDGLAKTDLVAQVFGRQFVTLLPAISGGAAVFDESAKKMREFGGVLGSETIAQLARADDAVDDLQTALRALRDQIGALFGPVQEFGALIGTWLVAQMTNVVQWVRYAVGAMTLNILATWDHLLVQLEAGFDRLKLKATRALTFDQKELADLDLQLGAIDARVQRRTREINTNLDELKLTLGDEVAGFTSTKDTRPGAPSFRATDNISERAKVLDAQLKQRLQELQEELRAVKNTADLELAYVQSNRDSRLVTETEAAGQIQTIHLEAWDKTQTLWERKREVLATFYRDSVAIGFKDKESRLRFEAEFAEKASTLREQLATDSTAFVKAGVADQDAIRRAGEHLQADLVALVQAGAAAELQIRRNTLAETVTIEEEKVKALEVQLVPREAIAAQELNLLRAKHRQELDDERLTAAEITAIRARQAEEIKIKQIEAYGSFWDNYLLGLKQFVNDNQTGFGMARQMAIDTAQAMSQAFEQFFFNVFTGKIRSMMELLQSFLNSVLQALSSILARMVTTGLLQGATSGLGGLSLGFGGGNPFAAERFSYNVFGGTGPVTPLPLAAGGLVMKPTYALVGESGPEAVIPLDRLGRGGGTGDISIVVHNNTGTEAQASARSSRGPGGEVLIQLVLDKVKAAFNDGSMDTMLGANFGINRRGASR